MLFNTKKDRTTGTGRLGEGMALRHLQAPDWVPLVACVVLTAGLRGLAVWRNWELPAWRV